MKHQALFSSKGKSKKITVSSAAILLGALKLMPPLKLLSTQQITIFLIGNKDKN